MNWYKMANRTYQGYKMVGFDGKGYYSLYDKSSIDSTIGSTSAMGGAGMYLGTTPKFCTDYYSGLVDGDEALLTYEYNDTDILKGDPNSEGEVQVKQARLISVQNLPKQ